MNERRKFVRIPEHAQISYQILNSQKEYSSLTKDISQGGIRFWVQEFIPENTHLKIKCTLEKISFSFEAVVRLAWITEDSFSEKYEVGVEFLDIPKKAAERLVEYIDYVRQDL